jgi:hypothetical protein
MPPLAVRVQVAERQLQLLAPSMAAAVQRGFDAAKPSYGTRLEVLIGWIRFELGLEPGAPMALDHDPALILRKYNPRIKDVASRYTPHAHDPNMLLYREKADHGHKTTGRRPGAARTVTTKGSDIGLKTKFARLERKKHIDTSDIPETGKGWFKKAHLKIPSRPFPNGRGFRKP